MYAAVGPDAPVSAIAGRGVALIIIIAAIVAWRWLTNTTPRS